MKLVDCPKCNGSGRVTVVPFYANPMPKKQEAHCEECNGEGKFEITSGRYFTITEERAREFGLI